MDENDIGTIIVDSAFHLHQAMGPGLLESVYETVLEHLLKKRGLTIRRQVGVPISFEGIRFDEGFRADLIVNDKVIIEIKSVEKLNPAHKKQLLTYLKLTGLRLGYLLNFGEELMKTGIIRIVNGLPDDFSAPPRLCENKTQPVDSDNPRGHRRPGDAGRSIE